MATKISVYVDEDLHRSLKAAASLRGVSLSDFMVAAAVQALHQPERKASATSMDSVRSRVSQPYTVQEIRSLRNEGRRM